MARKSMHDLLGGVTRFGRLTVLGEASPYEWKPGKTYRLAQCRCDCGAARNCQPAKLRSGQTLSCGCYSAHRASVANKRHGLTGSPAYRTWASMKSRCYNPRSTGYQYYGGRGIEVCERWRNSFEAFLSDMGPRPDGMSIERIEVDGNYEPGNCRWADSFEQADNRTDTHHIEVGGGRVNLSEAQRRYGLTRGAIRSRIRRGMTSTDAVLMPPDKTQGARSKSNNRYVEFGSKMMLLCEVAEVTGVDGSHLNYHIKRGRSVDEAVAVVLAARAADKALCPQGHQMSGDNLYVSPKGGHQCKACRKDARARSNAKAKRKAA